MSLLEVTIGSMMVAVVTMMAASIAVDMTRNTTESIRRTRVATQARLAIESFRRDFGGNDPDQRSGDRSQWRLIGRQIPNAGELRLCYDSDVDGTADWIAPDRVITYTLDEGQLIRSDQISGNEIIVADLIDEINFSVTGGSFFPTTGSEIRIEIEFALGDVEKSYIFNTPDF